MSNYYEKAKMMTQQIQYAERQLEITGLPFNTTGNWDQKIIS